MPNQNANLPDLPKEIAEKLNDREHLMAYAYVRNGCKAEPAALEAGFAESTARKQSARWIGKNRQESKKPHLYDAIEFLMQYVLKELQVTEDDIFKEMAKLGFSSIDDYFEADEQGRPRLKKWDDIPEEKRAAISSIEIDERSIIGDESESILDRKIKFKLYDKRSSLETLGKYFAMWKEHKHISDYRQLTREERLEKIKKANG